MGIGVNLGGKCSLEGACHWGCSLGMDIFSLSSFLLSSYFLLVCWLVGCCISYLSIAVIKLRLRQFIEGRTLWAYGSRRIRIHRDDKAPDMKALMTAGGAS